MNDASGTKLIEHPLHVLLVPEIVIRTPWQEQICVATLSEFSAQMTTDEPSTSGDKEWNGTIDSCFDVGAHRIRIPVCGLGNDAFDDRRRSRLDAATSEV